MLVTVGVGSTQHLTAELLRQRSGMQAQQVPFRTTGEVVTALLRNDVAFAVELAHAVRGHGVERVRVERLGVGRRAEHRGAVGEVGARAKRRTLRGQHNAAHATVFRHLPKGLGQFGNHFFIEGIANFGTAQGDGGHGRRMGDAHCGHGITS